MGATCWPRPAPGQPSSWRGGEGRRAWSPPRVAPFSSSPSDCQPGRSQRAGSPGGRATGSGLEDGARCPVPGVGHLPWSAHTLASKAWLSSADLRLPSLITVAGTWRSLGSQRDITQAKAHRSTHTYTQHTTFSTHIHTSIALTHTHTQHTHTPHAHTCTNLTRHAHTHTLVATVRLQLSRMSVDVGACKYSTTSSINFHSIHFSRKFSL